MTCLCFVYYQDSEVKTLYWSLTFQYVVAPKGADVNCSFTSVETVQRCPPATV